MISGTGTRDTADGNRCFRTLADGERRRLLTELLEHEAVAVPEGVVGDDTAAIERIQQRFVHVHLPRLEAEAFVRWHRQRHVVVRGPEFETIRPLLELLETNRDEFPFE